MSTTRTGHVSLPDALRDRTDDQLRDLLASRPDLITPLPADIDQLASRAGTRGSLQRALDRLDRYELAVMEALVVLGPGATYDRVRELLGTPDERLRPVLAGLRDLALVWGPDDTLAVPHATSDLLGPHPAGLGPDTGEIRDPEEIDALLAKVGPDARALVDRLAAGPPIGLVGAATRVDVSAAVQELLARGLLIRHDPVTVALPRDVGLHLRGGRLVDKAELSPPDTAGRQHDPELVDRIAAGTALEVIRRVEQLLDEWAREGPVTLKTTGLGVRDLKRATLLVGVDEHTAATYLEAAAAAGLIGLTDASPARWAPTEAYDRWRSDTPARRWAILVAAWLDSSRTPGLVGSRDDKGRPRAALSADVNRPGSAEFRRLALDILAAVPPGTELAPDQVLTRARWTRPRRLTTSVEEIVGWALTEAAGLGLIGRGAIAGPARALLVAGAVASAAAALGPLLPAPVDHVLLQADLTAVAPGPLQPDLARSLALLADAESHGGATVYRFTPGSVRRALDAGRTLAQLQDLLAEHSKTPVPQPLSYLLEDVARRHGRLRAGTATSYLRCDDEALLESVLADRRTAELGLRLVAPTVLVSRLPVRTLVDELRQLGYAPVTEATDGSLTLARSASTRAAEARTHPAVQRPRPPEPAVLAAAVRSLRAGDRARAARPSGDAGFVIGRTASAEIVRVLQHAVEGAWTVWIGYADQHGTTTERIIDPIQIAAGRLDAFDHAAGVTRGFLLHRITGIARVDPDA